MSLGRHIIFITLSILRPTVEKRIQLCDLVACCSVCVQTVCIRKVIAEKDDKNKKRRQQLKTFPIWFSLSMLKILEIKLKVPSKKYKMTGNTSKFKSLSWLTFFNIEGKKLLFDLYGALNWHWHFDAWCLAFLTPVSSVDGWRDI